MKTSSAERMRKLRERRKKRGLIRLELWLPAHVVQRVREFAQMIKSRKNSDDT